MAQRPEKIYTSKNWPKDRPSAASFHLRDAKLTFRNPGESIDFKFTMSETLPSGDSLKYQVTLLTRLVYGKSVVLDALIDNEDGKLFDRYGLHNLKELDFRRMIGIFYGYDMNYIQNADELWTLWGMGTLFEAESVEEFCYMKLAAPDLSLQVVYEAGTVYPDGSISDFIILENESVKKIDR